jgi:hypothetical protein
VRAGSLGRTGHQSRRAGSTAGVPLPEARTISGINGCQRQMWPKCPGNARFPGEAGTRRVRETYERRTRQVLATHWLWPGFGPQYDGCL